MIKLGENPDINLEKSESNNLDYKLICEFEYLAPLLLAYDDKIEKLEKLVFSFIKVTFLNDDVISIELKGKQIIEDNIHLR